MDAFLTGSRAYGTPTEDSDIDLVVLINSRDMMALAALNDLEMNDTIEQYGMDSACLRFGRLNLICVTERKDFDFWKDCTRHLAGRRPVSREEAVAYFSKMRGLNIEFDEKRPAKQIPLGENDDTIIDDSDFIKLLKDMECSDSLH